jgi:8-oxo-dGTP pyrophosphatase MutT (NUDIX family)
MQTRILRIESLDLTLEPFSWRFAAERRAAIDAYFAAERAQRPELYNGRVLLSHRHEIDGTHLRAAFFETDFASFMAWRAWDFPDARVVDCFTLGALQGADGGYLLGIMGAHTSNHGQVYFPGGTLDPSDVTGARVDLEGNLRRELREETGLDVANFAAEPGWHCLVTGPMIALIKTLRASEPAARLRERILDHLASEDKPELAGIALAESCADLSPRMPVFVQDFLRAAFAGGLVKGPAAS